MWRNNKKIRTTYNGVNCYIFDMYRSIIFAFLFDDSINYPLQKNRTLNLFEIFSHPIKSTVGIDGKIFPQKNIRSSSNFVKQKFFYLKQNTVFTIFKN